MKDQHEPQSDQILSAADRRAAEGRTLAERVRALEHGAPEQGAAVQELNGRGLDAGAPEALDGCPPRETPAVAPAWPLAEGHDKDTPDPALATKDTDPPGPPLGDLAALVAAASSLGLVGARPRVGFARVTMNGEAPPAPPTEPRAFDWERRAGEVEAERDEAIRRLNEARAEAETLRARMLGRHGMGPPETGCAICGDGTGALRWCELCRECVDYIEAREAQGGPVAERDEARAELATVRQARDAETLRADRAERARRAEGEERDREAEVIRTIVRAHGKPADGSLVEAVEGLAMEHEDAVRRLGDAREARDRFRRELTDARAEAEAVREWRDLYQRERDEAREQLEAAEAERDEARKAIAKVEAERDQAAHLRDSAALKIAELRAALDKARADFESSDRRRAELAADLVDKVKAERERAGLASAREAALAAALRERDEARAERDSAHADAEEARAERDNAHAEAEEARAERDNARADFAEAERAKAAPLVDRLDGIEARLRRLEEAVKDDGGRTPPAEAPAAGEARGGAACPCGLPGCQRPLAVGGSLWAMKDKAHMAPAKPKQAAEEGYAGSVAGAWPGSAEGGAVFQTARPSSKDTTAEDEDDGEGSPDQVSGCGVEGGEARPERTRALRMDLCPDDIADASALAAELALCCVDWAADTDDCHLCRRTGPEPNDHSLGCPLFGATPGRIARMRALCDAWIEAGIEAADRWRAWCEACGWAGGLAPPCAACPRCGGAVTRAGGDS